MTRAPCIRDLMPKAKLKASYERNGLQNEKIMMQSISLDPSYLSKKFFPRFRSSMSMRRYIGKYKIKVTGHDETNISEKSL